MHNCSISPTPELQGNSNVKSYLGRPWKKFSRTVILQSYIDAFIDPEGWLKFNSMSDLASLYYARVNWPGYHILSNLDEVKSFIVENFIRGRDWLPKLGIPFIPGLA
ncbi:hypothetical protein LWI29_003113 [Acer saccharum]|uniref:Pectinesterase catalytic domain-containing protein n=1 Tax=Acer saccharum TaxID=4024 RepID=A0AA39SZH0_ACESA|nr:hypothetical protein LWI29_003113 [Acer saccharum]